MVSQSSLTIMLPSEQRYRFDQPLAEGHKTVLWSTTESGLVTAFQEKYSPFPLQTVTFYDLQPGTLYTIYVWANTSCYEWIKRINTPMAYSK